MKAEVAELHPPADLVVRLRPQVRRSWHPSAGGTAAALASVAAVAIAVVAITLPRHHQPAPGRPAPAAVPALARSLVAKLAVLRRPQTAADRLPAGLKPGPGNIASLTRLALTLRDSAGRAVRVYVVVRTYPADVSGPPARQALASAFAYTPSQGAMRLGGVPSSAIEQPLQFVRGADGFDISVVPDGVARVRWVFGHTAVTASVTNNIASAPATKDLGLLLEVDWYAADGRLIASTDLAAKRARQQHAEADAIAASDKRPIANSLLEHFALFRQAKTAAESLPMPEDIAAQYARQSGGLNVGDARFVRTPGTETPIRGYPHGLWVIPGERGLCDIDTQLAGGCADLGGKDAPLSGGFFGTSIGDGTEWLTGIAPDGNRTVLVTLSNGTSRTVPVLDNVYSVAIRGARAVELRLRTAAGAKIGFTLG
jgi:hypothetical protein